MSRVFSHCLFHHYLAGVRTRAGYNLYLAGGERARESVLFICQHSLAKLPCPMDDTFLLLAKPFSTALRLFFTREPAQYGLANDIWR